MFDLKKGLFVGLLVTTVVGCSDPEPQVIDMNEIASEAGLSEDDYTVHENGAMEIHSKVDDTAVAKVSTDMPLAMQGDSWEFIVKNGVRTADEYAVQHNPASTFIGNDLDANIDKQYGGKYEGEYLLTVLNDNPNSISYAQLRPLFDMDSSSDLLDDESKLWEVTIAKFNGIEY